MWVALPFIMVKVLYFKVTEESLWLPGSEERRNPETTHGKG